MKASEATEYIKQLLFSPAHRALYTSDEVDALHYVLTLLKTQEALEKPPAPQIRSLEAVPRRCSHCHQSIHEIRVGLMAGQLIHSTSLLLGCITPEGTFFEDGSIAE
jgi:hypothetical protein